MLAYQHCMVATTCNINVQPCRAAPQWLPAASSVKV
jgi:hypothetical protein